LNIDFGINNERQDYRTVKWGEYGGSTCERRGGMKEMKVREYGRWASYSYMN
jgi:hypothetical protein